MFLFPLLNHTKDPASISAINDWREIQHHAPPINAPNILEDYLISSLEIRKPGKSYYHMSFKPKGMRAIYLYITTGWWFFHLMTYGEERQYIDVGQGDYRSNFKADKRIQFTYITFKQKKKKKSEIPKVNIHCRA